MSENKSTEITTSDLILSICDKIKNSIEIADIIMRQPNCNTCGKNNTCKYVPTEGETVRINCPLWEEIIEEENCVACKIDVDNPIEGQMSIDEIK